MSYDDEPEDDLAPAKGVVFALVVVFIFWSTVIFFGLHYAKVLTF